MADPFPRTTLGELARRALATTDREERAGLLVQLGHGSRTQEQIEALSERFLAPGLSGHRVFLAWVIHVRPRLPETVLAQIRTLLADRTIPGNVRVKAAARALKEGPDRKSTVLKLARPLTVGLSPLRRLERLRQLQHQVDESRSLDAIIERREQRLKINCPRCGLRFNRETMVRHLWHEHGLFLERGKVRSPQSLLDGLKAEHSTTRDTTILDRAALLASANALRSWVASSAPPAEDVTPLLAQAEEHGSGLCPGCFSEVVPAVSAMPPSLVLGPRRIAGDGYAVEIGGAEWLRTLTVTTPRGVLQSGPDGRRAFGPRGVALVSSAMFLLLTIMLAAFGATPGIVLRLVLAAAFLYGLVWLVRRPPANSTDRVVDVAWDVLVRSLVKESNSWGWLTRLCRTSVGHGDPIARTDVLQTLLERAKAGRSETHQQLLAAANVLLVEDGSRQGRDRVAGIAGLAARGFRGEESLAFAEYVAACFLDRADEPSAGDRARFRMMLLDAAFESGLKPRDLVEVWQVAPHLHRAMLIEPLHRIALLQVVWDMRAARRWERIASADSVFDLCRIAPHASGRILADYPDLLLHHRPDPDTESQLGPILICARGIAIGGIIVADPDVDVRIEKTGRYGTAFELILGTHRVPLERRPVGDFAGTIKEWLRFRSWSLLPLLDNYLTPGSPPVVARLLRPFQSTCPNCGARSAITVGNVGRPA